VNTENAVTPVEFDFNAGELAADAVLAYMTAPPESERDYKPWIKRMPGKKAVFTIVNDKTGTRLTFRTRKPKGWDRHMVDVLVGSDNSPHSGDYKFIGMLAADGTYRPSRKSKVEAAKQHLSEVVLTWTIGAAQHDRLHTIRVLHHGHCARCGRALTVPSSVDRGIGPDCATMMGLI
jgi:hypothetical protein